MSTPAIAFTVNGTPASVAVDGEVPLLYVLRNDLKLKGTRFGCGAGACGSCTVLLDDRAVNSCDTPLWAAAGRAVTTVEGLGTAERPHPIQQAFLDLQAAQCGWCVDGLMMSVAALARRGTPPTEADLAAALARHLCRCGTHLRLEAAARRVLGLPPVEGDRTAP